jgi:hypothetical protein
VVAKDSAVTVTVVRKDPDGSYDVVGTMAGATVTFDVSADLASITQNTKSQPGRRAEGAGIRERTRTSPLPGIADVVA